MTEEEAKTKLCCGAPLIAAATLATVDGASISDPEMLTGCKASACMAWRWHEGKRTMAFLQAVQAHMQAQPKPDWGKAVQAVWAETGGQFERKEGGCGLAGAPQ